MSNIEDNRVEISGIDSLEIKAIRSKIRSLTSEEEFEDLNHRNDDNQEDDPSDLIDGK